MLKKLLGFLVWLQIITGEVLVWSFGMIFVFNIELKKYFPQYFGSLITILLLSQVILGISVFFDIQKKKWPDSINKEKWKKLFLGSLLNFGYATVLIAYYFAVMKEGPTQSEWWNEKRKKSVLFKTLCKRKILDFLSNLSASYILIFWALFILLIIGFVTRSDYIFLTGFKLIGLWLIFVVTLTGLFQFIIFTHMVSKKWEDYSFEKYFTKTMFFMPGIELRKYYYEVVREEL